MTFWENHAAPDMTISYRNGIPLYKLYNSTQYFEFLKIIYCYYGYGPCDIEENRWLSWPSSNYAKGLFFNILGRSCHLLADMSLPEHVGNSVHIDFFPFLGNSPFEEWLGKNEDEFYWTGAMVYEQRGGIVNPFCTIPGFHEENGFLFYTMGQITDWFFKAGNNCKSGNSNYDVNIGEIHSVLQSYSPDPDFYQNHYYGYYPETCNFQIIDEVGRNYRDVLIPYAIRATAGLMYKMIIETKMQYPEEGGEKGTIFDQQPVLNLYNQDIGGNNYMFRAEGDPGSITVCPSGSVGGFNIQNSARNVYFKASNEIVLNPGFTAEEGAEVHAWVKDCSESTTGECAPCLEVDFNPQYDKSGN